LKFGDLVARHRIFPVPAAVAELFVDVSSGGSLEDFDDLLLGEEGLANERELPPYPALKSILAESDAITTHTDGIAANLEGSSKQLPVIAADVERIAATSSRNRREMGTSPRTPFSDRHASMHGGRAKMGGRVGRPLIRFD
jgi:hypothetical protein